VRLLSVWRRHPLAGVAVLTFALLTLGGLYALVGGSDKAEAQAAQSTQVEDGQRLFATHCASCHGMNAEGSREAPTLIGVGAASVDFQVGTGRMPAARPSQQIPRKPVVFNDEEIAALAAYVASLAPGPAVPAQEYLDVEDADIAAGGELFRTNCASCHGNAGKGGALTEGKYAPELYGVEPRHIYEAMVTGPQNMPVFSDAVLRPEEKRDIIGYVKTLESEPNPGGLGLGRLGPVSEGLWAWVVGIGALVVAAVWIAAPTSRVRRGDAKKGT